MALREAHALSAADIAGVEVKTFHEAIRLATAQPTTTEEAQYSTSFPVAVALVRGKLEAADIMPDELSDPQILALSQSIKMSESDAANDAFPLRRKARVTLTLKDGRKVESDWVEPKWEHLDPPRPAELISKFESYAAPVVGPSRSSAIRDVIDTLDKRPAADLLTLMAPAL